MTNNNIQQDDLAAKAAARSAKGKVERPSKGSAMKRRGGTDRRLQSKEKKFEENMYKKMDGEEVPKTLRVSDTNPFAMSRLIMFAVYRTKRMTRCQWAPVSFASFFSLSLDQVSSIHSNNTVKHG